MKRWLSAGLVLACVASATSAEVRRYAYDARGRLISVYGQHGDRRTDYNLDKADNRTVTHRRTISFRLNAGQSQYSPNGQVRLTMQADGNLVLFGPNGYLWAAGTSGAGNYAVMQGDGHLVVYNAANLGMSITNTYGAWGAILLVQNDGNMVIYDLGWKPIWQTGTGV